MRYAARHRFHAAPDMVAAVLADPDFYRSLRLPDVAPPTVLEHARLADETLVRLRFVFAGRLDPVVTRLLAGRELAWVQEVHVTRARPGGRIVFAAEGEASRLRGEATFRLDAEGDETVRALEGDLVVSVPGIGRMAERRIVPGLLARLAAEAEALDARLPAKPA